MARSRSNIQVQAARERSLAFVHCDVFSRKPYSGNSLSVFLESEDLTPQDMLTITREMRHFESIFLHRDGNRFIARIFDLVEELPLAGHPILGAACALHRAFGKGDACTWTLELANHRTVQIETRRADGTYRASFDQGRPLFLATLPNAERETFADAFGLQPIDLAPLPLEIISTGLRYLLLPIRTGLEDARVVRHDLTDLLSSVGAEFAYLLDVNRFEGRHWTNDGAVEDAATGSAAGVVGAYALKHGLVGDRRTFTLRQGRFIDRPSEMSVTAFGETRHIEKVHVAGDVAFVGEGAIVWP